MCCLQSTVHFGLLFLDLNKFVHFVATHHWLNEPMVNALFKGTRNIAVLREAIFGWKCCILLITRGTEHLEAPHMITTANSHVSKLTATHAYHGTLSACKELFTFDMITVLHANSPMYQTGQLTVLPSWWFYRNVSGVTEIKNNC